MCNVLTISLTHDGSFYDEEITMTENEELFLEIIKSTTSCLIVAATELERLKPSSDKLDYIKSIIKSNLKYQDLYDSYKGE